MSASLRSSTAFYNQNFVGIEADVDFADVPRRGRPTTTASVRDLWAHEDLGVFTGRFPQTLPAPVEPHATMMFRLIFAAVFV